MICKLGNTEEEIKSAVQVIVRHVSGQLGGIAANKEDFDLNGYIYGIYDYVRKNTGSPATAFAYAQMVPFAVLQTVQNSKPTREYLKGKLDLNVLTELSDSFLADVQNVIDHLGYKAEEVGDLEEIEEANRQMQMAPDKNREPISEAFDFSFMPRKGTWESTTSNETITMTPQELVDAGEAKSLEDAVAMISKDPRAYQLRQGNRGIINPEMAPYFDFIRDAIRTFNSQPDMENDSRKLKSTIVKDGFYLTAMSGKRIPANQLDSNTKRWISVGDAYTQKTKKKDVENTLVFVVTNEKGEFLHFDKVADKLVQVKPSKTSKVIYYTLNRPDFVDGKIDYKKSGMMTPAELIKSRGMKLKPEAYKAELKRVEEEYAKQEKTLAEIEKFIKKNPDKNQIRAFAIGGSLGTIKKEQNKTSLTKFDLGKNPVFHIVDVKGAPDEGYAYLKTENISTGVPVWNRNIERTEAAMIADFLTEDIYEDGVLLTAQNKYDRIYPFVQVKKPNGLSIKVLGNILDIRIGETYYTIANQKGKARAEAIALAKQEIVKVLTKPYYKIPMKENAAAINNIVKNTKIKLWDSKDPNIHESEENDIVFVKKGNETIFYKIHKPTWNIDKLVESDRKVDDFTNYTITEVDGKMTLGYKDPAKKQVYYTDWVINNAKTYAGMNAEKKIMSLNPYFEVAYEQDDIAAMTETPVDTEKATKEATAARDKAKKEAPKTAIDEKKITEEFPDYFEKNLRQKGLNVKATMDQLEVAKKWWPNSPLAKHIAFREAFNLVNTSSPTGVAEFTTTGGILLYKGSDYSDIYHEAWHAFTQMFLTKEQKDTLYKDAAAQSGSFTTYEGRTRSFATASIRELEEYLAEEFRAFMLSDGKDKTPSPKRNKIFQFILDVLNALFEGVSIRQAIIDRKSNKNINDLFEKLRVGNILEYTFSEANADFKTLNKGISATDTKDPDDHISYSESKLVTDSMDVMIAEMDFDGKKMANPAKAMKNEKIRAIVYKKIKEKFDKLRNDTQAEYDAEVDPFKKQDIKFNLDTLNYVVAYYGSLDNKKQLLAEKGVIAYHLRKTRYLKKKDKFALFDKMQEDVAEKRDHSNREGNKNSLEYLASEDIVALMASIYKKQGDKGEGLNRFGIHEFESERTTWNAVAKILEGVEQKETMYAKMLENSHETLNPHAHIFAQLVAKLGNPIEVADKLQHEKFRIWEEFKQAFDRVRIKLKQVTIDKIVDTSDEALDFGKKPQAKFTIHTGETTGREKNIIRNWESNFRILTTNLIKNSPEGNYLDLEQLFNPKDAAGKSIPSDYAGTGTLYKNMDRLFLADIGISLTQHPALEKELNDLGNRARYAPFIYNTLKERYKEGVRKIKNLKDIFEGEETNFNKLAALEAKYNPIAGFMVTTAENNTQFEHSQQSTATRKTTAINNAESWGELMQLKHMAHLNHDRSNHVFNFFTRGSRILDSLFDAKTGKKRSVKKGEKVRFEYDNFSGISLTVNNLYHESGVAAAEADEASKMLADLFTYMQGGTSEGSRTSDRGTTYLYYTSDIVIAPGALGAHTGKYYVDPAKFLSKGEDSKGREERDRIMMQYISNEASRVDYMQNLPDTAAEHKILVNDKGLTYAEAGSKFVIFDDILSKGVKAEVLASIKEYNTKDHFYDYLKATNPDLYKKIAEELNVYFDKQTTAFKKKLKEIGLNNAVKMPLVEALNDNRKTLKYEMHDKRLDDPYTQADKLEAIAESYITNSWIHMYEGMAIFYGDMALFVDPDNFIKRITGATSPGLGFSNDVATRLYNSKLASTGDLRPYAKKYAQANPTATVAKQFWDGTATTSVFKDVKKQSVYLEKYTKILERDTRERFKNVPKEKRTLSDKQIDSIVKEEIKAYTEDKMEIGNGQGWISFDSYRILKKAMGEWSQDQEKLFQRILSGENIPARDIMQFFPVAKYQYFGPLDTNGTPVTAFHKFSLMPLVPSVIKGTELEDMHNRMVEQGIDYALFQTGSKVATLTSQTDADGVATPDAFRVDDVSAFSLGYKFTPNRIFLEYLKDQMSVPDEYKNKATFSTQLRKIIESGFMEFGVPTDFAVGKSDSARVAAWDSMRVYNADGSLNIDKTDRIWSKASKKYAMLSEYREQVRELTELKKQELLRDAGIELDADGNYKGNMEKILKMISAELEAQDLSEHEIDYIQFDSKTGKIRNDLSFSPSADKIERILIALVNKRLINQKVNGEGLVLVSNTGFQPSTKFKKATAEDIFKYGRPDGTDGLSFYDIESNAKGEITGKRTKAMKVKVAMKGSFQRLLSHPEVVARSKEKKITRLASLNELIKDEKWLDKEDNRRMVTMVGVRIPVQGLNSMEFMEVAEFLPKEAGSILIPPAEIVAKSGSDFDIDKLMVMMPNIIGIGDGKVGMANYNEAEIKQLWQDIKKKKIEISEYKDSEGRYIKVEDPISENLVRAIFGENYDREYTVQEIEDILRQEGLKPYEQFRTNFMIATTENKMLTSMVNILAHPDNFASLIRPNGTYLIHGLADELGDKVRDYDPNQRNIGEKVKNAKGKDIPSPTRAFEVLFNLYKHQAHSVGKQTLGIGAVENAYNVLFNGVGAYMESEAIGKVGAKEYIVPQKIYLPHNSYKRQSINYTIEPKTEKLKEHMSERDVISLGHLRDANGEYVISDIISQLINGWVDVAKDTWVFDIQGNKETAPTLLFALAAGVPLKSAVYLVSNPLVRAYIKEQKIAKSEFGDVLELSPTKWQFFRNQARGMILSQPKYGVKWIKEARDYNIKETRMRVYTDLAKLSSHLNEKTLGNRITETQGKAYGTDLKTTDADIAAFLQYLSLEDMGKITTKIKMNTNFDTKKTTTTFAAMNKELMLEDLKEGGEFPGSVIDRILSESPIGSFNIQKFIMDIWSPLFEVRNNKYFTDFILSKINDPKTRQDIESTFGDGQGEKFVEQMRNDFAAFIYQNAIRGFELSTQTTYRGYRLEKKIPVEATDYLPVGAFVKGDVLYVNEKAIREDYVKLGSKDKSVVPIHKKYSLGLVDRSMFDSVNEYQYFVIERAYLLSVWNIDKMKGRRDFSEYSLRYAELENSDELAFQSVIRDMAMDNTFNAWKTFKSPSNAAYEYQKIKALYPDLIKKYPVFEALVITKEESADVIAGIKNKYELKNIRLQNPNLTPAELEMFHDNLADLSNDTKIKTLNKAENQRISEFFKRLPYVALIQSGLDTNTSYSLGRMIPFNDLILLSKKAANMASRTLNNPDKRDNLLNVFYRKFVAANSMANFRTRSRFKDYLVTETDMRAIKAPATSTAGFITTMPDGTRVYDQNMIKTDADAVRLAEANPTYVFIYEGRVKPRYNKNGTPVAATSPDFNQGKFSNSNISNALAIPIRKDVLRKTNKAADHITDATLDQNKQRIDDFIKALDHEVNVEMRIPVWPRGGVGQVFVGAEDNTGNDLGKHVPLAPETFDYLSKQLYKAGYLNKNFVETKEGAAMLERKAPVTNKDIEDQLLKCYGKI